RGNRCHRDEVGQPARINSFDGEAVARQVASLHGGRRHFEDSLGICAFTTRTRLEQLCRAVSAATGRDYRVDEVRRGGRRAAGIPPGLHLRFCAGPELEYPSTRYGSVPVDGPAKGQDISTQWERMLDVWYETIGYDRRSGQPTRETLEELDLLWLNPTAELEGVTRG